MSGIILRGYCEVSVIELFICTTLGWVNKLLALPNKAKLKFFYYASNTPCILVSLTAITELIYAIQPLAYFGDILPAI